MNKNVPQELWLIKAFDNVIFFYLKNVHPNFDTPLDVKNKIYF